MKKQFYMYVFFDPRNGEAFYVGKGLGWRYNRHLKLTGPNLHLKNRIKAIRKDGFEPIVTPYLTKNEQEAFDLEREFIALFGRRDLGTGTLCNYTNGGEGSSGRQFTHTAETKERIRNSTLGRKVSVETRDKMSLARKGVYIATSEETRAKIAATQRTMEFRKRMSETQKRIADPAHLARITELARQSNLGKPISEETKAKMSAAQKGRQFSEETKARMSLGQYRRQARLRGENVGD